MSSSIDPIPSTYLHIYRFLKSRYLESAAKALKKAVKDVVVLRDDVPTEEPLLHDIIVEWKQLVEARNKTISDSSSSSSSSESDSSSNSSSDSSSSSSSNSDKSDETSSSSDNSSSSSSKSVLKRKSKINKVVLGKSKLSSSEDTSSFNSSDDENPRPGEKQTGIDSYSSSESSDEEKLKTPAKKAKGKVNVNNGINNDQIDTTVVVKKRKISQETSIVTATTTIATPSGQNDANNVNGKKVPRKTNNPFQRIKLDEVKFADDRLRDNSFQARGASRNDYGERANKDLIVTKGAGFRKEKNKKKRGSYRGGEITMQSHSIIFD